MGYEVVDDIEVFDLPKVVDGEFVSTGQRTLPHYTSSLDAAWEGAAKALTTFNLNVCVEEGWHEPRIFEVSQGDDAEHYGTPLGQSTAHPAEALVLACLRAVGVAESDLE